MAQAYRGAIFSPRVGLTGGSTNVGSTFQGGEGFRPIRAGYEQLSQMQRRDAKVIRDLKDNQNQQQQVQLQYIQDLAQTFTREEANRRELKALEDQTRETRTAAIRNNFRTEQRNSQIQQNNINEELKSVQALTEFSTTLSKQLQEYQQQKNASDMEDEYNKALIEGLPGARQAILEAGEDQLRLAGNTTEQIADGLAANGVDPAVVMQVRTGNKWRDYGRLKAYAELAGDSYGGWLEQQLQQLGPEGNDPNYKAAAIQQLQTQFLKENGLYGLSADFLGPMFKKMRRSANGLMNDARRTNAIQQSNDIIDTAQTNLFVNKDGDSLNSYFTAVSRGYGRDGKTINGNRAGVDAVFSELSDVNRYSDDTEVLNLLGSTMTANGQTWGQRYPGRLQDLLQERREGARKIRGLRDSEKREEGKQWQENLVSYLNTQETLSGEVLEKAIKAGQEYGFPVDKLKALEYKTLESQQSEKWDDYFEQKFNDGTLTPDVLNNASVPIGVRNKWRDQVNKFSAAKAESGTSDLDAKKGFRMELRSVLNLKDESKSADSSIVLAESKAMSLYNQRFAMYSKTMTPTDAQVKAYNEVIDMIAQGKGQFRVTASKDAEGTDSYFPEFRPGANTSGPPPNLNQLEEVIRDNGAEKYLNTAPIIPQASLKSLYRTAEKGNIPAIPPLYMDLGRRLGMNPRDILDMQFKAIGLTPPPRIGTVPENVSGQIKDPRFLELLRKPTIENQNAAVISSGQSIYSSRDPRGQSLIAMAARNQWDPADLAAIFSFETGGTLNPSEPGRGAAAGRIGLIQGGPNERAAYGLGSGNWDKEMIAVEKYLLDRGAKPGMGLEDLYATVNGGNPGEGWKADGNGTVARAPRTLALLQEHRVQAVERLGLLPAASNPARDRAYMSPTLAYISGNIGPTSTGQHLDVKRTDGSYFNYNDLDPYVMVDDPELGRVPLGATPETGDWESHTRRGSHGRDYGLYDGTKIYLTGGARVISNRPSVHGDVLTIKVPDGRMFTFLHGKAS